jgi:hypothetical protein
VISGVVDLLSKSLMVTCFELLLNTVSMLSLLDCKIWNKMIYVDSSSSHNTMYVSVWSWNVQVDTAS